MLVSEWLKGHPAVANAIVWEGSRNFTAGCWGSVGLIRAALRVINIPAELRIPANHAQS